ncbi:MAG: 50S ribosomal protein L23 [Myxococcales bacterium]|nr:50S ribosomal protein L23 [Myxococcales bacterium]
MRAPQSIIKRPLLTEKSARLRETGGAAERPAEGDDYSQQVVFEVAKDANKIEIRHAIESLFKVSVTQVRTIVMRGKAKRVGRFSGQRPAWKKAFVTLKAGDTIAFFEGV